MVEETPVKQPKEQEKRRDSRRLKEKIEEEAAAQETPALAKTPKVVDRPSSPVSREKPRRNR